MGGKSNLTSKFFIVIEVAVKLNPVQRPRNTLNFKYAGSVSPSVVEATAKDYFFYPPPTLTRTTLVTINRRPMIYPKLCF